MEIKFTTWHRIFARNLEVVRKSPFVVISFLFNNLSLLYSGTEVDRVV